MVVQHSALRACGRMRLLEACGHALCALKLSTVEDGGLGTVMQLVLHPVPLARNLGYMLLAQGARCTVHGARCALRCVRCAVRCPRCVG